ncbi:flavodoxin family protein [Bacteroidota bacterium]
MIKNILTIIGSPRKKGNTSWLIHELLDHTNDPEKDIIFTSDHKINPCTDCRGCKKGDFNCIVKDDMQDIYSRLGNADLLIFGTPIYWFGPSAQLKLLIDRLRPYYGNKRLKGKKAIVVMAAGSGEGDTDLCVEMFKRTFSALGIEFIGKIFSHSFDIGDAAKDKSAKKQINEIAKKINPL